jgi:hypothetical protein
MIASAAAAVGAGVPTETGDPVGPSVGSPDVIGATLGGGSMEGCAGDRFGSCEGVGSSDGPVSGVVVAGAPRLADEESVGVGVGDAAGAGAGRVIGTTKIEPPVLDALNSTTAACSAWGSSTTDPGFLTNDATRLAPASIEAQSDDGAASWGQTVATLAMFMV